MSFGRHDRPLDELLDHMARWKPEHGPALTAAAGAVRAIFAGDPFDFGPRVLITNGWDVDPVVAEVENVAELVDEAVPEIRDRLDDILRLLRDRPHEPATDNPTPTGAAS